MPDVRMGSFCWVCRTGARQTWERDPFVCKCQDINNNLLDKLQEGIRYLLLFIFNNFNIPFNAGVLCTTFSPIQSQLLCRIS